MEPESTDKNKYSLWLLNYFEGALNEWELDRAIQHRTVGNFFIIEAPKDEEITIRRYISTLKKGEVN